MSHASKKPTDEQRAEWAKIKKRAIGNVAGCLVGITLLVIPFLIIKFAAWQTARAEWTARFTVPLVKIDQETSSLAVATIFAVIFAGVIAGAIWSKARLLWPVAICVFIGITVSPAYFWYRGFMLVSVDRRGQAELRYLWPRPSVKADVSRVGKIDAIETEASADDNTTDSHFKWFMTIEIDGKVYTSTTTSYPSRIFEAQNRLLREKFSALLLTEEVHSNIRPAAKLAVQLGDANAALDDFTAARDSYAKALLYFDASPGPPSADVARAIFKLGRIHMELKDFTAAEPLFKRAMDIHASLKLDGDDPDVIPVRAAYKNLLEQTGRPEEARAIVLPPNTLLSVYTQRYGKEEARKRIEAMMEERRRNKTGQ